MPTYEYACIECGQHIEVVQSMSDASLTQCGACGGRLRKVFAPIGIVFKGSGFYRTDSRGKSPSSKDGLPKDGLPKDGAKTPSASSPSPSAPSPGSSGSSSKPAEKSA